MVVYHDAGSAFSFGEQASPSVVAATKNKWMGPASGEFVPPMSETEIEEIRGNAGTLDPVRLMPKVAKLEGSLDITVQHAWPFYWLLGAVASAGAGPYTRTYTGSNALLWATLHQILGKDDGSASDGIDWIGSVPSGSATFGCAIGEALQFKTNFQSLTFDDTVAAQSVSAVDREPYKWDGVEWYIYEPGTTTPLTGLTTPAALEKWEGQTGGELDVIHGQRSSNAHLPVRYTKKSRSHKLSLGLVPEADRTLFRELVRNRSKFDFVVRHTRGADDYIELRYAECYANSAKHKRGSEDGALRVDVPCVPRKLTVTTVNSFSTLLAEA